MKISFAITTHNEGHYIDYLFESLSKYIKQETSNQYEIIVVDDFSQDPYTGSVLQYWELTKKEITLFQHQLNGDFSAQKNFLNSKCTGDYIFQLDADESISYETFYNITEIIKLNPEVEAFWLPRINTVHGLTLPHVQKWNWLVTSIPSVIKESEEIDIKSEWYKLLKSYDLIIEESYQTDNTNTVKYKKPVIQWPDYQMRLYKNDSKIHWINKVHEQLAGYKLFSTLPPDECFAIQHHKMIDRQEKQNEFYATI